LPEVPQNPSTITENDYALMRLDTSNYKLVIAELEKRAHITVASV